MARVEDSSEAYMSLVEGLTSPGYMMGTGDYLAPEQATDAAKADGRADIYSLGCTLHELVIGTPPFQEKGIVQKLLAHKNKPPPSLRSERADIPQWLDDMYLKMMAKDPADRYQTATEVIAAIERGRFTRPTNSSSTMLMVLAFVAIFVVCIFIGLAAAAAYFVLMT
jgi:serine/threonine protein kinase